MSVRPVEVALPTALLDQAELGDGNRGVHRLAHVVDGQGGHGGSGQGFHFHPGLAGGATGALHMEAVVTGRSDLDVTVVERERMAEGNEG